MVKISDQKLHDEFVNSKKKHILMITNHGTHQWNIIPGLPDTGGQNVFVNQFTNTLTELGYKITIANRGGYAHPTTGVIHEGLSYQDENQRILYIEDSKKQFVRKEDMDEQIPQLAKFLKSFVEEENIPVDLICSHYWDGAKVGVQFNKMLSKKHKHVWIPHSLGSLKKSNMEPEKWAELRIDERIQNERDLINALDGIGSTSSAIGSALKNDYNHNTELFLPPCVNVERFHPRTVESDHEVWSFLAEKTGLEIPEIQKCKIVTEISRTDNTKRKDVLIKAFAKVHEKYPETLLIVAIDENEPKLYKELTDLIKEKGIESHTAVIGNEWKRLPYIYGLTRVYCSPSVMEGFGMSVQEAAATEVPVVGTTLIPFVKEYLITDDFQDIPGMPVTQGLGAFLVGPDHVDGFAFSIEELIKNDELHKKMAKKALNLTIPYFTWEGMTKEFFASIGFK